jgi:hypothetical protein
MTSSEHADTNHSLSDALQLHLSVRAGDPARMKEVLDRHPELVDVPEEWNAVWSHKGIAPYAHRGTPMGRAVALGHQAAVETLLTCGADVDGACGCVTQESPLWTAIAVGRHDIASLLIARGADANRAARSGITPLHIAAMRDDLIGIELLLRAGANRHSIDRSGRTPLQWAVERGHTRSVERLGGLLQGNGSSNELPVPSPSAGGNVFETGIRAFDLFCPLGRGRLLRQQARVGHGHFALLAEVTHRWLARPNTVVAWCGFEPRPYSLLAFDAELRELGLGDRMPLLLMAPEQPAEACAEQLAAFVGEMRTQAEERGIDVILVMFEEVGHVAAIERVLPSFGLVGNGSLSGIVSGPFRSDPDAPPQDVGPPYAGRVEFDLERSRRGRWPALGNLSSSVDESPLAARTRAVLAAGGARAERLHEWFTQPFYVHELVDGLPGEWTPSAATWIQLESLLGD